MPMKFSIGELEHLTGMNRTTLRYYDAEGLIDPERMENGYRNYSREDLASLVQLKQLQSFGLELSDLPSAQRDVTCREVHQSLVAQEQAIGEEIEDLYQKLARLRLHMDAYGQCLNNPSEIREGRMVGAYRLYIRPRGKNHPRTAEIFQRWMEAVPETYTMIRIPGEAMLLPPGAVCDADTGIGLLSSAFRRLNEKLEEPVEYTPPSKCIGGMIELRQLEQIPRSALDPFIAYIDRNGVIPLGDFHGWVVYAPVNREKEPFRVFLRLGIH